MRLSPEARHWFGYLFGAASLCIILAYIALGLWSYSQGDNLYYYGFYQQLGFWPAAAKIYEVWTGRLPVILLELAVVKHGLFPYYTNLLVTLNLCLLALALAFTLRKVTGGQSIIATLADIAFLFLALPNKLKQEAFYWFDGSLPHLLPVWICLFALYGINTKSRFREPVVQGFFGLLFICLGAFSESFSLMCITAGGLYLVLNREQKQEIFYPRLLIMVFGMGAGLLMDALAPGNYARLDMQRAETTWNLTAIVAGSLKFYAYKPLLFFVVMLCYALCKAYMYPPAPSQIPTKKAQVNYLVLPLLAAVPVIAVSVYLYRGDFNAERALLAPYAMLFLAALAWVRSIAGRIDWHTKKMQVVVSMACAVIIFIPGPGLESLMIGWRQAPYQRQATMHQFDLAYEAQQQDEKVLMVPAVKNDQSMLFWEPLMPDPTHYLNRLFAEYFGLEKVYTVEP